MASSVPHRSVDAVGLHAFHLRGIALLVAVGYWSVALTYQDYVFVDPRDSVGIFRQVSLWSFLIGWFAASVGTPWVLSFASSGSTRALGWLPYTALAWPVGILLAQVSAYQQTGQSYLGYLFDEPVFVLTDVVLPAYLAVMWSRLRQMDAPVDRADAMAGSVG